MTHDEAGAELSALIDGALEAPRRAAVESHLAGCDSCRERLGELKSSIALFKAHARKEAPAALKTRVLARAQNEGEAVSSWGVWKPAIGWSFAAAGVLLVSATVLRKAAPMLFEQPMGMISGAAGFDGGGGGGYYESSPAPAEAKKDETAEFREQPKAVARRPAQAVELDAAEAVGGASAGRGYAGAKSSTEDTLQRFAAKSRRADDGSAPGAPAAAPALAKAGLVPELRVFKEESEFKSWWKAATPLPPPQVDFGASMVVVLTRPPMGKMWSVVAHDETLNGEQTRILYKDILSPGPGAPVPPTFRIVPRSEREVVLIRQ